MLSRKTDTCVANVGPQVEGQKSANSSKVSLELTQSGTKSPDAVADQTSPLEGPSSPLDETPTASRQTSKSGHPTSMRNALRESFSKSPSRSSSPSRPPSHVHRSLSGTQAGQISVDAALGAGKSIKQIVGAGVKSPMDFTLSLARGFHNAPKLYGDESVRQADKVTGLQSGLKAAGKVHLPRLLQ